jgi:actin-related protein 3
VFNVFELCASLDTLVQNIVLSGGSTLYRNFNKRLEEEIQDRVNTRLKENMERISKKTGIVGTPTELPVNVVKHKHQRYAVWLGGSFVAGSVRLRSFVSPRFRL